MLTNFTRNGGGVLAVNGQTGVVTLESATVPMTSDLTPLGFPGADVDAVLNGLAAQLGSALAGMTFDPLTGNLDGTLIDGTTLTANLDGRYQVIGTDLFASTNGTIINSGADGENLDLDVNMDAVAAVLPDATAAELAALAGTEEVMVDFGGTVKMMPLSALSGAADTFTSTNGTVINSGADASNLDLDIDIDATVDNTPAASVAEIGALADSDEILVEIGGNVRQLTLGDFKAYAGDVSVTAAGFNSGDGVITLTKSDGSTVTVDIDGRFVQTVNAIVPDAAGNVPLSLTAVETGDLASRPAAPADATVYVVSNDADPTKDGQTFIYHAGNAQWYQVASFDVAANDARYVNVAGDTMAGQLILNADPTVALEAATKQYVDSRYDWIGFSPAP